MTIDVPITSYRESVQREWIDYNGHMNVAYYGLIFDHATDQLMDGVGVGPRYVAAGQGALFVVESHMLYQRELHAGDTVTVESRLLGFDQKRIHLFHRMHHAQAGFLAATSELMLLHVDQQARRSAAMPDAARRRLEALAESQADLPMPEEAGRRIAMPKPKG
jgi:acyl-CoA thioester hydrolase